MSVTLKPEATRAVVLVDGVARAAFNEDGSFELLTPAAGTPTGADVPTAGQLGFGKMYESPEQVITAAGLLTLVHGLGSRPKLLTLEVVCTVADAGYAVGDRVCISYSGSADGGTSSVPYYTSVYYPDSNNIGIRFGVGFGGSCILIGNKATGASAALLSANWRLIVRAWS